MASTFRNGIRFPLCAMVFLAIPAWEHAGCFADLPASCGVDAVTAAVALTTGEVPSESDVVGAFTGVNDSHTLDELKDAARKLRCIARLVRFDPANARLPDRPVIVRMDRFNSSRPKHHFVVLYGTKANAVQIIDFPRKPQWVNLVSLQEFWDGEGLEIRSASDDSLDLPMVMNGTLMLMAAILFIVLSANIISSRKKQS